MPALSLIHANIALKNTRTGQLLNDVLQGVTRRNAPQEWEGMEMFLKQQVRQTDPRLDTVYGNFEQNLSDIVGFGVSSGAKVIVSTVGSNLRDCAPFASLHPANFPEAKQMSGIELYDAGIALERESKHVEAAAEFQRADAVDDQFAELHFRLARCLSQDGRLDEARRQFVQARDLDYAPVRGFADQ